MWNVLKETNCFFFLPNKRKLTKGTLLSCKSEIVWRILGHLRAENSFPQCYELLLTGTLFLLEHLIMPQKMLITIYREIKKLYFQSISFQSKFKKKKSSSVFLLPCGCMRTIGTDRICRTQPRTLVFVTRITCPGFFFVCLFCSFLPSKKWSCI